MQIYRPSLLPFDVDNPTYMRFRDAKLENGDILQYRGSGLISSWIRFATHGVHSHSAMLRVDEFQHHDVLEIREFKGGRAVPLVGEVEKYPGRIDVFRPRDELFHYNRIKAVEAMRELTARDYGYWGIARLAAQRVPFLWRFLRTSTKDIEDKGTAPFCSHAVALACRAGNVDPVPRKPDDLVTPADLTNSLLFDYRCTLVP